jgi:hypothetical protein
MMTNLNRSPKLRLQAALFDLIEYCEQEDQWGIKETWLELDQQAQEQIWSFLSSQQKVTIREALAQGEEDETVF